MNMMDKIKNFFLDDHDEDDTVDREVISARAAKRAVADKEESMTPAPRKLKSWVKTTLTTTPWLVFAIVLFGVFVNGAIVKAAIGYGLFKVALAVVLTLMADETMFRSQKDVHKQHGWVPMIRRSAVFMGICWLMAVT